MNAELKFECKNCIEDITTTGKQLPSMQGIRATAAKEGWHIGRDAYCSDCLKKITSTL